MVPAHGDEPSWVRPEGIRGLTVGLRGLFVVTGVVMVVVEIVRPIV